MFRVKKWKKKRRRGGRSQHSILLYIQVDCDYRIVLCCFSVDVKLSFINHKSYKQKRRKDNTGRVECSCLCTVIVYLFYRLLLIHVRRQFRWAAAITRKEKNTKKKPIEVYEQFVDEISMFHKLSKQAEKKEAKSRANPVERFRPSNRIFMINNSTRLEKQAAGVTKSLVYLTETSFLVCSASRRDSLFYAGRILESIVDRRDQAEYRALW